MKTVVTAGHVDHGKSTLVRALTGMEPDRLAEEHRRGLSIELGFAWGDLGATTVAFVDVPGHERFVARMLAGAGSAPAALLVVAADQGWQEQTQEHLEVLELLGVPVVAVVVTRAQLASAPRVEEVVADVTRRLASAHAGSPPVVVADSLDGGGLDDVRRVLVSGLASLAPPPQVGVGRLWLDRVFSLHGVGTVVTGTLLGGSFDTNQELVLMPDRRKVRVRGLHSLGVPVVTASPGDRVAVNLGGVDVDDVDRGQMLVAGPVPRATRSFDAVVRVLPGRQLGVTGAWRLHVGSSSATVRVRPVRARTLHGPVRGAVRLHVSGALPLLSGDPVVIRDDGRRTTVAGGEIIDPLPDNLPNGADGRDRHARLLEEVAELSGSARARRLVDLAGGVAHGQRMLGLLAGDGHPDGVHRLGDHLVTHDRIEHWSRTAARAVSATSRNRFQLEAALVSDGCPTDVVAAVLDFVVSRGVVARRGPEFVNPDRMADYDDEEQARREALVELFERRPFAPPALADATRQVGATAHDVQALIAQRRLVRQDDMVFAWTAVERAADLCADLGRTEGPFTAGRARQALGTTRKFAIPLLEVLDRLGVTEFDGKHRVVRSRWSNVS